MEDDVDPVNDFPEDLLVQQSSFSGSSIHSNDFTGMVDTEIPPTLLISKLAKLRKKAASSPDGGVVLQCSAFTNKLSQALYLQHKDGRFCDFALSLGDGIEVLVHRSVLAATSTYFSCLFDSGMVEAQLGRVELRDMNESALKEMIRFMYTGKIYISKDTVTELLDTACHLQIDQAIRLASHYLITTVQKWNCVEIYLLADKYNLAKLKQYVMTYIKSQFVHLPNEQLFKLNYDLLVTLLESNGLLCTSEWDIFSKVDTWLRQLQHSGKLKEYTVSLTKLIRFPLMTGEELVSKVSQIDFMRNEPECIRILTEAKDYHIVQASQPVMQTNRSQVRHSDIIYMAALHRSDFYVYPLFSKSYKLLTEPIELRKAPRPLLRPAVCVYNNFLYACGGVYDSDSTTISSARCFRYDPRTDSWFEIASMNEARQKFGLQVIGDYMFAIGGCDDTVMSNSYEVYTFSKDEWKTFTLPAGFHQTNKQAVLAYKDSIYVTGGHIGAYVSSAAVQYMHDNRHPGSLVVRKLPNMHMARRRHRMFAHNDKIFCVGGLCDSIEVFDVLTEQWTLYPGFSSTLGSLTNIAGICALDPTRVIISSFRLNNVSSEARQPYCLMLNLEKDLDKEKLQFVRKLNVSPKLSPSLTSFGTQLWMPALDALIKMNEAQV